MSDMEKLHEPAEAPEEEVLEETAGRIPGAGA
jgi:hypothetical protein